MAFLHSIATTHASSYFLWLAAVLPFFLSACRAAGSNLRHGQALHFDAEIARHDNIGNSSMGLWRSMPLTGHKQSQMAVEAMLSQPREEVFAFPSRMPIMLPDQKLLFCVPPKVSCTSLKLLMTRLIGIATPEDLCSDGYERLGSVVHQELPSHDVHSGEWTYKQRHAWGSATSPRHASDAVLRDAFLSHNWTTIQLVRDPWYRAVSSYQDQIARGHYNPIKGISDASDFLNFTLTRSGGGHHTGVQAKSCGNQHVEYDYFVKLEDLDKGLRRLIRKGALPNDAIYTGWERCTGHAELTKGPVHLSSGETHASSIPKEDVDGTFCNARTVAAVHDRYVEDYEFLSTVGMAYPDPRHQCKGIV
mmetsp:Transcript_14539/g.33030  ORF Transcript_14539/g.33030 Transcript_14539/m.33030 type:complete len:362 (-) Transcript_14539:41-1126(-)